MPILTTNGIEVRVRSYYVEKESDPSIGQYVFSYDVQIINHNKFPVRLLKRRWEVFDALGVVKIVEGDGVLGRTPLIQPGEMHAYSSWVPLISGLGDMVGSYLMERGDTGERFLVDVPSFELAAPQLLN